MHPHSESGWPVQTRTSAENPGPKKRPAKRNRQPKAKRRQEKGQNRIDWVENPRFWRKLSGPGGNLSKMAPSRGVESPSKNRGISVAKGAFHILSIAG